MDRVKKTLLALAFLATLALGLFAVAVEAGNHGDEDCGCRAPGGACVVPCDRCCYPNACSCVSCRNSRQ
jgi:hypothetical protein